MAEPGVKWDGVSDIETQPRGLRLGVLAPPDSTHPEVLSQSKDWFKLLQSEGFTLVDVPAPHGWNSLLEEEFEVLLYDFKADLNAYLARFNGTLPVRTLADLIEFNSQHAAQEMPFFGQELFIQAEAKGPLTDAAYLKARADCVRLSRAEGIDALVAKYKLDAIVTLTSGPAWFTDHVNGDRDTGGCTTPAAVAGYPHITVPAGLYRGLPIGLSFFSTAWSEPTLIKLAYAYEQATQHRRAPVSTPPLR